MTQLTEKQLTILDEAADWVVRLDGQLSPGERRKFADWLCASPENIQEFLHATSTFQAFEEMNAPERVPLDVLLREKAPEVIPLFKKYASMALVKGTTPPARSFWQKSYSVAASLFILIGFAAYLLINGPFGFEGDANIYATTTGEQRSISLSDGSVIYLNTRSRIRVRYEEGERALDLLEGEALFKVAHDPTRPFRVYSGKAIAEAVGTTFNVYRKADRTNIAVIEGKVAVFNPKDLQEKTTPAGAHKILLTAGQETAVLLQGEKGPVRRAQLEKVTSWQDRRLIFEGESMANIAREFNRYNTVHILIDSPELNQIKFDGIFDADQPEAFIRFLEMSGTIKIKRPKQGGIYLTLER